jgi:hypothetical protein
MEGFRDSRCPQLAAVLNDTGFEKTMPTGAADRQSEHRRTMSFCTLTAANGLHFTKLYLTDRFQKFGSLTFQPRGDRPKGKRKEEQQARLCTARRGGHRDPGGLCSFAHRHHLFTIPIGTAVAAVALLIGQDCRRTLVERARPISGRIRSETTARHQGAASPCLAGPMSVPLFIITVTNP